MSSGQVMCILGLACAAASCVVPDVELHGKSCDDSHPCLVEYACVDHRCVPTDLDGSDAGGPGDAAVAPADAGLPDAGLGEDAGICAAGTSCTPEDPCHAGTLSCDLGIPECIDTGEDVADGTSCRTGRICHHGACSAGCLISDAFYANGQVDPAHPCRSCAPSVSTATWTDLPDGTICLEEQICHQDECSSGCFISDTYYASGDPDPSNFCQGCQPGTSTSAWTMVRDGTECDEGRVCNQGACSTGCWISGEYVAGAAANPADPCQGCQPGASTVSWTDLPDGTSCGRGRACIARSCQIFGAQWLAAGDLHTCALVNGGVQCWGSNDKG
ncbi:MAG: hypothetical protein HY901_33875, partial [Deltaproteobacteria bacterium]|nr:hypothetical protein [Deltaproteobacteria bacterium]